MWFYCGASGNYPFDPCPSTPQNPKSYPRYPSSYSPNPQPPFGQPPQPINTQFHLFN